MARVIVFLLLASTGLAAEDKKPDAKTEIAALKGKWKVTATTFNGKEVPLKGERVIVFDEKQFTALDGGKKVRTLAYTLDPTGDPRKIDLSPAPDQKALGIYSLKGDSLELCYGEPGAQRPKKLESKEGDRTFLIVLERVKP